MMEYEVFAFDLYGETMSPGSVGIRRRTYVRPPDYI